MKTIQQLRERKQAIEKQLRGVNHPMEKTKEEILQYEGFYVKNGKWNPISKLIYDGWQAGSHHKTYSLVRTIPNSAKDVLNEYCTSLAAWSWNREQAVLKAMQAYADQQTTSQRSAIKEQAERIEKLEAALRKIEAVAKIVEQIHIEEVANRALIK